MYSILQMTSVTVEVCDLFVVLRSNLIEMNNLTTKKMYSTCTLFCFRQDLHTDVNIISLFLIYNVQVTVKLQPWWHTINN